METNYDVSQLNSIIKYRRSIYPNQYIQGKEIPGEIVWQILENANRAPNHKQTEPWRFTVFCGEGLKHFAEMQADIYKRFAGNEFKQARYEKLLSYPLMSSHVIAIRMKRSERKNLLPEIEEIEAVACAIENMFLTATAYGLGCYLSTAGITYMKEAKPYFDLGAEDKLLGFFYLGYRTETTAEESKRGPVHVKVKWIDRM
jgi:nitroreductase